MQIESIGSVGADVLSAFDKAPMQISEKLEKYLPEMEQLDAVFKLASSKIEQQKLISIAQTVVDAAAKWVTADSTSSYQNETVFATALHTAIEQVNALLTPADQTLF